MADLRKVKDEALQAAGKGNWRKAAWCYANLEKDEPAQPSWSLKLGECLRRLGNDGEAIKALERAVNGYAKSDLLLKAIAVCKIILSIDPKHSSTQELLAAFCAAQRKPTDPGISWPKRTPLPPTIVSGPTLPAPAQSPAAPPAVLSPPSPDAFAVTQVPRPADVVANVFPASLRTSAPAASPGQPPLRHLRLSALLPGSRQSEQILAVGTSGAMEIAIDDESSPGEVVPTSPHKGAGRNTMARFVLPKTPFFAVLTRDLFRMAVERVRLIQLAAGETLFSRGDPGDALYVVAWGEVAVLAPHEVARLAEGEFFGEIALLADRPRSATVRATVDSQVLAIDCPLLRDLIAGSPELLKVLLRFL
ncbi:MAG TPA: cyclic nucleotide-binding domain-containing protein, partial [Polyangia bacterium]